MTGIPDEFDALVEKAAGGVEAVMRRRTYDEHAADPEIFIEGVRHIATAALEAIGLPALLERVKAAEGEGCDCTELCSMGPTCPGGTLAGLDGSGCWRTGVTE